MKRTNDLKNKPEISIIVPVYNSGFYVQECIDSLCKQTFSNIEIILVEDGSTDDSSLICERASKKDSRITCIHNANNSGPVYSRKIGFQRSQGQYIGFVDSDDWVEHDMYEKLYRAIKTENVDISMCARYEDSENDSKKVYHGIKPGKYEKKQLEDEVYPTMIVNNGFFEWGIFPGLWDKLFKRDCIENFLLSVPDSIRMGDDAVCTFPCVLNANSIYILDKCLYHYRQTLSSLVRRCVNVEVERKRFKTLYRYGHSVMKNDTYDIRNQWLKYCLFLMIPRADVLYRDLDKNEFLFPFPKVGKGSRIIIYGMGLWGQRLNSWVRLTNFCKVVGLADRNYKSLRKQGLEVDPIDEIINTEHDMIVVTASYEKTRNAIINDLRNRFPAEVILELDKSLVFSNETLDAFGLSDE